MQDVASHLAKVAEWRQLTEERRSLRPSMAALDAPRQAFGILRELRAVREFIDEVERAAVCDAQLCGAGPEEIAGAVGLSSVEELEARWPGCVVLGRV